MCTSRWQAHTSSCFGSRLLSLCFDWRYIVWCAVSNACSKIDWQVRPIVYHTRPEQNITRRQILHDTWRLHLFRSTEWHMPAARLSFFKAALFITDFIIIIIIIKVIIIIKGRKQEIHWHAHIQTHGGRARCVSANKFIVVSWADFDTLWRGHLTFWLRAVATGRTAKIKSFVAVGGRSLICCQVSVRTHTDI